MSEIKSIKCLLCDSIAETQLVNLEDIIKDGNVAPYRTYKCKTCGNYISADLPWLLTMGYDLRRIHSYINGHKVLGEKWLFFGEEQYYKLLLTRNENIVYLKSNEVWFSFDNSIVFKNSTPNPNALQSLWKCIKNWRNNLI